MLTSFVSESAVAAIYSCPFSDQNEPCQAITAITYTNCHCCKFNCN